MKSVANFILDACIESNDGRFIILKHSSFQKHVRILYDIQEYPYFLLTAHVVYFYRQDHKSEPKLSYRRLVTATRYMLHISLLVFVIEAPWMVIRVPAYDPAQYETHC